MARHTTDRPRNGAGRWISVAVAVLLGILGLVLAAGGIWLILLGGSWYYAFAGLGLMASAWLLWRGSAAGPAIYGLVWVLTLAWTIWEVGFEWWAWVPRMVAPTVLLLVVLGCLPLLSRRPSTQRATP